ncbi:MAG: hypothetical protein U9Q78_06360, partial [Chloroflexota bacterium]|nr:hypothetical protein [Chloroflexota bacterium]
MRYQIGNSHLLTLHVLQEKLRLTLGRPASILRWQILVMASRDANLSSEGVVGKVLFGWMRAVALQDDFTKLTRQFQCHWKNSVVSSDIVNGIRKFAIGMLQDKLLRVGSTTAESRRSTMFECYIQSWLDWVYDQNFLQAHHPQILRRQLSQWTKSDDHRGITHHVLR